ncbi:MAG: hypothetical protein LBD29_05135 [Treponema sp.]|nr:hypothetical protein [Treponema sp.]
MTAPSAAIAWYVAEVDKLYRTGQSRTFEVCNYGVHNADPLVSAYGFGQHLKCDACLWLFHGEIGRHASFRY